MSLHRQQGAVLVVSLFLLLLITAIAASTLTSSTFQTVVANNAQQRETVFRVAESTVEKVLPISGTAAISARTAQPSGGVYDVPAANITSAQPDVAAPTATVSYAGDDDGQRLALLPGVGIGGDVGYYIRDYEVRGSAQTTDGRIATAVVMGIGQVEPFQK